MALFVLVLLVALVIWFARPVRAASSGPPARFEVQEWLKGSVTPGASHYTEGGSSDHIPFEFEILIAIPDLDRYLADPAHSAPLSGTIKMADTPARLSILEGHCQFFIESGKPGRKHMTYRMVFAHPTRGTLTLFGRKDLRCGFGSPWPHASTLYTDLVPGNSPARADFEPRPDALARGVLHILPLDFIRSQASMRAPGTGLLAGLETVRRFGRFFTGEIWKIYGVKL